jgi:hypothetical protein
MSDNALRRRVVAATALRPGERIRPFFAWDFSWCDCAPAMQYNGVSCITVALSGHRIARCVDCNTRFIIPARRRADRMLGSVR